MALARVIIGRLGYALTSSFWLWRDSTVCIGDEVTSNGFRAILGQSDLIIGRDTMISDEVVFQTFDQHGIVDLSTMKITNQGRRHMTIGEHVWVGRRTMIMRDVSLGSGSVVDRRSRRHEGRRPQVHRGGCTGARHQAEYELVAQPAGDHSA